MVGGTKQGVDYGGLKGKGNNLKLAILSKIHSAENRRKIEMSLLVEVDRNEIKCKEMTNQLIMEFKIFKEMASSGVDIPSIVKSHLTFMRTFEVKNLIGEDRFLNEDYIYMVFEGFCGIYKTARKDVSYGSDQILF